MESPSASAAGMGRYWSTSFWRLVEQASGCVSSPTANVLRLKYVVPLLLAGFVGTATRGSAAVGGSPFYEFKVVAKGGSIVRGVGGEFPLSHIEPEVSINDNGRTVFTGHVRRPTGIASAVVTEEPATGTLYWLNNLAFSGDSPNPNPFASLTFLDPQIVNDGTVVVSELVGPDVRIFNGYETGTFDGDQNSPPWVTVRYILRDNNNFVFTDEAQGSISEDGVVSLVVTKREGLTPFVGTHWLDITFVPTEPLDHLRLTDLQLEGAPDQFFGIAYPASGLGGATVVNTDGLGFGGAVVYVDTALQKTNLASTDSGWQKLGTKPGIRSDGKIVAFVGRDANGVEGIFIQIFDPLLPQSAPVPVITTSSVIGMGENESPIHFSGFDFANRTPIIRNDSANDGKVLGDSLILSFIATPSSESIVNPSPDAGGRPLLFSSGRGIWTIKVDVQEALGSPGKFLANTAGPIPVLQVGDKIDGAAVDQLYLWDGLGLGLREFSGALRRTVDHQPTPRDHLLAFAAHTADGNVIVKAAHLDTDEDGLLDHWERPAGGIDMDRDGQMDLRLDLLGASDMHKDLFLEIDWLEPRPSADGFPGGWKNEPQPGALKALKKTFQNGSVANPDQVPGIALHIDAGSHRDTLQDLFSQDFPLDRCEGGQHVKASDGRRPDIIGNGNPLNDLTKSHLLSPFLVDGCIRIEHFHNLRSQFFANREKAARELAFRYCILTDFAVELNNNGGIFRPYRVSRANRNGIRVDLPNYNPMVDAKLLPNFGPKTLPIIYLAGPNSAGVQIRAVKVFSVNPATGSFILQILGPGLTRVPTTSDAFVFLDPIAGAGSEYVRIENTLGRSVPLNAPLSGMANIVNFHTLPDTDFAIGLGQFGPSGNGVLGNPSIQWRLIAHEFGHCLGLLHGGNNQSCLYSGDCNYSLMSYSHLDRLSQNDPIHVGGPCFDFVRNRCRYQDLDPITPDCEAGFTDLMISNPLFFQQPYKGFVTTYSNGRDPLGFNEWEFMKLETWSAPWTIGNAFGGTSQGGVTSREEPIRLLEYQTNADTVAPVILLDAPLTSASIQLAGTFSVSVRIIETQRLNHVTVSLDVNGDGLLEGPSEVIQPGLSPSNTFSLVFSGFNGSAGVRSLRIEAEDLSGNLGFINPNIMVGAPVLDTRPHTIVPIKPVLPADLRPIVRIGEWFEVEVSTYDNTLGAYVPTNSGTVMFTFDINGDGATNGSGEIIVARAASSNVFHVFFPDISGAPGNRTLRIVSTDEWLNQSVPLVITVKVLEDDSTPPTLSFVAPVENSYVASGAVLSVEVMARDTQGVAMVIAAFDVEGDGDLEQIQLYSDFAGERFRGGLGVDPFFNRGVVGPGGRRDLTVTATDQLGNSTNITRTVTVLGPPPASALIVLPAEGSSVRTNGTLTVEVATANATSVAVFFDRDGNGQTNGPGEAVIATATAVGRYRATFPGISGPTGSRLITAVAASSSAGAAPAGRRIVVTDALLQLDTVPGQRVPQSSTFTVQLELVPEADSTSPRVLFDSNGDGDTEDPGEMVRPLAQEGGRGLASFSNITGPPGVRFVRGEARTLGGEISIIAQPIFVTDGGAYASSRSEKLAAVPFTPELFNSWPQNFIVVSNRLYFSARTSVTARELWCTDGTRRGTFLLKDIRPGEDSGLLGQSPQRANSGIDFLTAFQDRLFFSAFDGVRSYLGTQFGGYGRELWSSDGTPLGTKLFKDIRPPGYSIDPYGSHESSEPSLLTVFQNRLFFIAQDGTRNSDNSIHGVELWSSDGTAEGTTLFKDVNPGYRNGVVGNSMAVVENSFYFTGPLDSQLWKSDGTPAGTVLVKDLTPVFQLRNFVTARGLLFFESSAEGVATQLWRSDGTAGGTYALHNFSSVYGRATFTNHFLLSADDGINGIELWQSDGTIGGTVLVKDISPGSVSSVPVGFTAYDGLIYFSANDGLYGRELWRTDGTDAGTRMVVNLAPGEGLPPHGDGYPTIHSVPESLTVFNGKLYFTADSGEGIIGRELWRTDGTAEGTELVKDLAPGIRLPEPQLINGGPNSSNPRELRVFDGRLYFTAWDPLYRDELWTSDGTSVGTYRLRNLSHAPGSPITPLPGRIVFTGRDLVNGTELWSSSPAGTLLLTNIASENTSSVATLLGTIGAQAFFAVSTSESNSLFVTDGTPQNTRFLASIPQMTQVAVLGDLILFSGMSAAGRELWRTDGTLGGTSLLKDINPGSGDSNPTNFFLFHGELYFRATEAGSGSELWKSDGTLAGTVIVADINPGPASSNPNGWSALDNLLVFWANDGAHGREPWTMDSSSGVTQLLKDIRNGPGHSDQFSGGTSEATYLDPRAVLNGVLYFRADDGIRGNEVWRTDGTPVGTKILSRLGYNTEGSKPGQYTVIGNTMFFSAENSAATGAGLYKTDGTSNGTVRVRQFFQKTAGGGYLPPAVPNSLVVVNGLLLFQASDDYGWELWRSDGTTNGTFLLKDIMPGLNSPEISGMTVLGNELYFAAEDPAHGRELWKTDGTSAGTEMVEDLLPGPESADPQFLTGKDGVLYYFANDGGDDLSLRHLRAGTPLLSVAVFGDQVTVSWPVSPASFALVQTASLSPPITWAPTASTLTTNSSRVFITIPTPRVGNRFYRLQ